MNQLVMDRTVARPAPAVRPARPVTDPATTVTPPHEVRSVVTVAAAVLAVLLLAGWSFAQGWGRGPLVGPGELAVDSGIARVDGVISAAPPLHAAPGMGSDTDPVPEGMRRISVDVTLQAGTGQLTYAADRFSLEVDGHAAAHLAHRGVLPGDTLPPGTQVSGTILFDVPLDATTGTLLYDGGSGTEIVIPAEELAAAPSHGPADEAADDSHSGHSDH